MTDPGGKPLVRVKEEGLPWAKRGYAEAVFSAVPEMLLKPVKRRYSRAVLHWNESKASAVPPRLF
jgi:hypothetical protein